MLNVGTRDTGFFENIFLETVSTNAQFKKKLWRGNHVQYKKRKGNRIQITSK